MRSHDKTAFLAKMTRMAEMYRQSLSSEGLRGYWEHLRSYRLDIVLKAIDAAVEVCKFLPTVADILEQIELIPSYHQTFKALPEPPMDPEETRRGLLLAGFAATALRVGLKPGTKRWKTAWVDFQEASDKDREILRRKVRRGKVKPSEFTSIKDILAGKTEKRKDHNGNR